MTELRGDAGEQYDVFLSFTRASPGAIDRTELIARALTARGLRVFRDERIDEFDGITAGLTAALAGSKVLLAYYTREFPERYACQWELTAAFVAAQREGDPRRRVLVVNPEDGTDHLAPVELADAKYAGEPDPDQLAAWVAARVAAVHGPLGAPAHPVDRGRLPAQVLRPERFVGRYPQMWAVHSALHAMDLTGVRKPGPRPAVLLSAITGAGKSSLAARYAYLYRDAYPGGVFWTGPFDGDADAVLARFADDLRDVATNRLGLAVDGVESERLPALVTAALAERRERVLVIVDDVPAGLPASVLDRLLLPATNVRTILTSRTGPPDRDLPSIDLAGLSGDDALAMFGSGLTPAERTAVRAFTERCGGHPMVLRSVANAVRLHHGPLTEADFDEHLRTAAVTVTEAVKRDLTGLDGSALDVLRVAAVLAPAPFPPALTAPYAPPPAAVAELVRRGLLQVVGTDWEVHPLVSETVRADDLHDVAGPTAAALLRLLRAGESAGPNPVRHAQRLGGRPDLPAGQRIDLLRLVVAHHESRGDPQAAARALDTLLDIEQRLPDLLSAARVAIACGRPQDAELRARAAIEHAARTDDYRNRDRARLLLARALDQLGRIEEADDTFWTEAYRRLPGWVEAEERTRLRLALAAALLLRGHPKDALAIVDPMVTELRATPASTDLVQAARLEHARLLQLTGKSRRAREIAAEVMAWYRERRMGAHAGLLEAETVWADAFLTLDLLELDGKEENWHRSERRLRDLAATYAEKWGADSGVTLAVRVQADRALVSISEPGRALRALAETEEAVLRVLGRHLLYFRVRHAMGLAHGQLGEFGRQRDILTVLLPEQAERLGRDHPETMETRLDLGIALAMTGDRARAIRLVDEAAVALRRGLGFAVDLSGKATTAQPIVRLPTVVLTTMAAMDKLFGPGRKKKS